jgi:cysteine synthase
MAWPIGSAFSVWVCDAQFTKRLNREEGITAGPSSGMNVAAGAARPAHRNHAS